MNNKSVVVENVIFIIVAICFGIILAKDGTEFDNIEVGWVVIGLIIVAFINLVYFKMKGKKAL